MAYIQERKGRDGKPCYRVQVRLRGYPIQTATFERRTDAKLWAQQTENAIREGRHFKTTEAKKHTLGGLIDRYIEDILPNKPKNLRTVKAQLLWWKQQLGSYALADVTPALIGEYRDKLIKNPTHKRTPRSPSTVVRYLSALSHTLTVAVKEWGWLEDSPMRKVTKPKEPRGRVRFLDDAEREPLLQACKSSDNPYLYPVVVLALSTGMRQAEIMNLKWTDIDLQRGRIVLQETKNGERRVVPITGLALRELKSLDKTKHKDLGFVFPSKHAHQPIDLRFPWEKALKAAGIEDFRFHDLRHSAASYLAMNGASLAEIAEVLGHKTLSMVKRYAHLSESHTAGVVASMNERIFG
jgi:integrase